MRCVQGADDPMVQLMLRWPEESQDSKLALWSEHACHELSLFLHFRDQQFFESVIKPAIEHKLHKTFVDQWLLGMDMSGWCALDQFSQLNQWEQALLGSRPSPHQHIILQQIVDMSSCFTQQNPLPQRQAKWFAAPLTRLPLLSSSSLPLLCRQCLTIVLLGISFSLCTLLSQCTVALFSGGKQKQMQ